MLPDATLSRSNFVELRSSVVRFAGTLRTVLKCDWPLAQVLEERTVRRWLTNLDSNLCGFSEPVQLTQPADQWVPTGENLGRQGRIRNSVVRACMSIAQNSFRTKRSHRVHPRCAANRDNQRDRGATN